MSLISINEFDKVSRKFKENKEHSKQLSHKLTNYVEENTIKEKRELEMAINKYNNKVKSIMDDKKNDISKLNDYNKQISDTLSNTYKAFHEASGAILNNTKLNDIQKEKKIQEISDYIMDNLYTKEEIEEFKKMANNFVILLPNQNEGYSKRVKAIKDQNMNKKKSKIEYF